MNNEKKNIKRQEYKQKIKNNFIVFFKYVKIFYILFKN